MASQDARMEIVIAAQAQEFLRSMQATVAMGNEVSKALRSMGGEFKQIQGAAQPAEKAMATLGDKIRDYKREQSGQARTVNFFVRELTEMAGLSREASGAVSGLGQVMIEAAAGGSAFAVGFEAVKFLLGGVAQAYRAAAEAAENFEKVGLIASQGLSAAEDALNKLRRGKESVGDQAYRETFDAGAKNAKELTEALEKARPTTWQQVAAFIWDGSAGMKRLNDEYAAAATNLDRLIKGSKDYAEQARNAAELAALNSKEMGPGTKEGFDTFLSESKAAGEASAKAFAEEFRRWLTQELRNFDLRDVLKTQNWDVLERAKGVSIEPGQVDMLNRGLKEPPKLPVYGGVSQKEKDDLAKMIQGLEEMRAVGDAAGSAVSGAFQAIGQAIGGAAGSFLATLGEMITKTIQLAIAATAASAAEIPLVGWLTAAGAAVSLAATLGGLIGGVPKYETGTSYVPRTGPAILHQGEAVIPAGMNGASAGPTTVNVTFNAPVDRGWWQANKTHIVDVIRDASRDRRL